MAEPNAIKVSDIPLPWLLGGSAATLALMLLCCFGLIRCVEPEPGAQHAAEQRELAKAREWKTLPHPELAYAIAEEFIKRQLDAPSTAQFPSTSEGRLEHVTPIGDIEAQRYRITSWVDAKNEWGVPIRQSFEVEVHRVSEDQWRLSPSKVQP